MLAVAARCQISADVPLTEYPATGVVGHFLNPTVIFGHSTGSQDRTIRARRIFGGTAWRLPEIHVFVDGGL